MEHRTISCEQLLDHLPGAIVIDMDGTVIYINEQCASYMNVDRERALNQHIRNVFPETKMLENLEIDSPKIVFYNSFGIGISVHIPIFEGQKKIGLLEYDVVQASEILYDFADEYVKFLDSQLADLQKEIAQLRKTKYSIENIIGESPQILKIKEDIVQAAKTNATVIIFGETGTGKEMVAHSIHSLSRRFDKEFVKFSAANIPENLVESELFGYEKGAFTGALKEGKKGKFENADKGTLYIDEINQMPLSVQPKLLRTLQENEIERIGGSESIPVDVRIIVTTNEDLRRMVQTNRFREDLFYRLHVIPIILPPLRERASDIPLLVDHFVRYYSEQQGKQVKKLSPEIYRILKSYSWPGNIRELENVVERAVSYAVDGELSVDFVSNALRADAIELNQMPGEKRLEAAMQAAERTFIEQALHKYGGNKSKAAEYLNIARPVLYKKMKRLGIDL